MLGTILCEFTDYVNSRYSSVFALSEILMLSTIVISEKKTKDD